MEVSKPIGRPMKGLERRITRSVRIEPKKKQIVEGKYETLQNWVDICYEREFGVGKEVEIVRRKDKKSPKPKEDISIDDF